MSSVTSRRCLIVLATLGLSGCGMTTGPALDELPTERANRQPFNCNAQLPSGGGTPGQCSDGDREA